MTETDVRQVLGDFWPRALAGLNGAPEKSRAWAEAFEKYAVEDLRDAAKRWHAATARQPTINDLLGHLGAPAGAPRQDSPELRTHACGTCGVTIREWFHHDGAPPKWRSLGDGGFLFQRREGHLYAVRCHECLGPALNRRGAQFLPCAREPAGWVPLLSSPLGPLLLREGRDATGIVGREVAAAIRRTQLAARRKPETIGGWTGGARG